MGIPEVIRTANDMGILSPLEDIPSLPLGACDVNLFELVNAYATVANGGVHVDPILVTRVTDSEGNTLYEATQVEKRALTPKAAFYMQRLLDAGVHDGGGTSQTFGAQRYLGKYASQLDMGGKTGTSNNHSDAWFVGVTPNLVGGAWVGGEYRSIHFRTGALGQGSRTALPIVARFMRSVMDDATLAPQYLKKYGMPPEPIDPSTYGAIYVPQAEPDSLEGDTLKPLQLTNEDLLNPDLTEDYEEELGTTSSHSDRNDNATEYPGYSEPANSAEGNKPKVSGKKKQNETNNNSLFE